MGTSENSDDGRKKVQKKPQPHNPGPKRVVRVERAIGGLEAYNIKITFQDAKTFFNVTPLPAPSVHPEILTVQSAADAVDEATERTEPEDSVITDFAFALFRSLGYTHRPLVACGPDELEFLSCGEKKSAALDLSIIDHNSNDIILVVQEDKQLPATAAIAAFQDMNSRRRLGGLEPLDSKVIPGIIMAGTFPTFFKIHVTQELNSGVMTGTLPDAPTVVTGHVPVIPRPNRKLSEGMKCLDNRLAILQCYEAFKQFIV
ncbi:hypothetical protein BDP27DRAFT_1488558 [Rhodocollybia butyracea]|uniref:Uncharacterized protein n=1 Tax=Rhodocollybia butyracea TaxID=206335 RepID=A0A9P5PET8_9AGAR|nr:hypothetical protein BDP27DRAFT_1488558 [Rhodocollybia butyracea]